MIDPLRGGELPPAPSDPLADGKRVAHNLGPLVGPDGTISSTSPADPSLDAPALVGTAAGLATQAEKLAGEVKGLRVAADRLAKRASRNEWVLALTSIGLILDIALSVVAFVLFTRLETSIHGTCTLYGYIISGYTNTARASSPLGPNGYDEFHKAMQSNADHLNCGIPHRI